MDAGPGQDQRLDPAILRVAGSTQVQIQLRSSTGYPAWPTTTTAIEQRYSDAPPAELTVLTPAAFVAAKMFADPPSEPQWENLLSHQGLIKIGPTEAAASVESWWASI